MRFAKHPMKTVGKGLSKLFGKGVGKGLFKGGRKINN
jgi:hypothetical protein